MCGQSKAAAPAVSKAVRQEFNVGQLVVASSDSRSALGNIYYRRGDKGVVVENDGPGALRVNFDNQPGNSTDLTPGKRGPAGCSTKNIGWYIDQQDLIAL